MHKEKLILIGGGGHCKACIDVIEQCSEYEIAGILDDASLVGKDVLGYKIVGTDNDIPKYIEMSYFFLITIGQIKSSEKRKKAFLFLLENRASIATVLSPRSYISKHAEIGIGSIVMHNVIVNAAAKVGMNCILNTGSDIEHDVVIGNHTHISTLAVVNGDCKIGNGVFLGSSSSVSGQINIGDDVTIGSGSIVIRDIWEPGIYVGNPVNKIKK